MRYVAALVLLIGCNPATREPVAASEEPRPSPPLEGSLVPFRIVNCTVRGLITPAE